MSGSDRMEGVRPQVKETERRSKINPFEQVFNFVLAEIQRTKTEGNPKGTLSLETRIMLYAWAGQIREMKDSRTGKTHRVNVNELIDGYGGIPIEYKDKLPRLGYYFEDYFEAVDNFVAQKIRDGKIDEETLRLLDLWQDCPTKIFVTMRDGKKVEITVAERVRARKEAGRRVIEQLKNGAAAKRQETKATKEGAVLTLESAGIESFVGRGHSECEDVGAELIFNNKLEGMVVFDSARGRQPAERYLGIFRNAYLSFRQQGLSAKDSLLKATEVLRNNDIPKNFSTFAAFVIEGQTLYATCIGDPPIYVYSKETGQVRRINQAVDITEHPNYRNWERQGRLFSDVEGHPLYRDLATGLKIYQSLGVRGIKDSIVTNEPQKISPVRLKKGDIVIIGSDGLQDNIVDNVRAFMAKNKKKYPNWRTAVINPKIIIKQVIEDAANLEEIKNGIIYWAKPKNSGQDDMTIGIVGIK